MCRSVRSHQELFRPAGFTRPGAGSTVMAELESIPFVLLPVCPAVELFFLSVKETRLRGEKSHRAVK